MAISEMTGSAVAAIQNPTALWIFQGVVVWWFFAYAGFFVAQAWYKKSLSVLALLFIAWTTAFWQEFVADWGAGLLYSPKFVLMNLDLPFMTANKPWFMPAAYGWWNTLITPPVLALISWLRRRIPKVPLLLTVALVAFPVFGLLDILNEGPSTAHGWWTYLDPIGPYHVSPNGAIIPMIFPAFLPYALMAIAYYALLTMRTADGRPQFEEWFKVSHMAPGRMREAARALIYVAVINVVYFLGLTLPCIAVRLMITGPVNFPS